MAISRKGLILDFDRMAQLGFMDPIIPLTRATVGSVINAAGNVESVASGAPRFQKASSLKRGLLIEPPRTNYISNSMGFYPDWWLRDYDYTGTATAPTGIANSAHRFVTKPAVYSDWLMQGGGCTIPAGYTTGSLWIYVESSVSTNVTLWFETSGQASAPSFSVPPNAWTRLQVTINAAAGAAYLRIIIPYSGNTRPTAIRLFGAQIEMGFAASSYIASSGSATNRDPDYYAPVDSAAAKVGLRSDMGTIVCDFTPNPGSMQAGRSSDTCYISACRAGGSIWDPGIHLWGWSGVSALSLGIGNSTRNNLLDSALVTTMQAVRYRVVVSWMGTTLQAALNGALFQTDLNMGGAMPALDRLNIGNAGVSTSLADALMHEIRVLPFSVSAPVAKALSSTVNNPL